MGALVIRMGTITGARLGETQQIAQNPDCVKKLEKVRPQYGSSDFSPRERAGRALPGYPPYLTMFLSRCPKFQAAAPWPLPYCTTTGSPCETATNSSAVSVKVTVLVSPVTG